MESQPKKPSSPSQDTSSKLLKKRKAQTINHPDKSEFHKKPISKKKQPSAAHSQAQETPIADFKPDPLEESSNSIDEYDKLTLENYEYFQVKYSTIGYSYKTDK